MSRYHDIAYLAHDAIATITLSRPQARNGYTLRMADELVAALDEADNDPAVRVVVITGAGSDFCVGADLGGGDFSGVAEPGAADDPRWDEPAGRCSMRIFSLNKPVIVAIHGAAVGAGITITLSADYRLAARTAKFGFVFSRRGIFPEGASTWFLPRLVGMGTALDWMVSGRVFGAEEAHAAGLVHRLYDEDDLLDQAHALARDLAENTAPVATAVIRQMLYRLGPLASPLPVQRVDSKLIAGLVHNPDALEGVQSFLERRPARFPGTVPADLPDLLAALGRDPEPPPAGATPAG